MHLSRPTCRVLSLAALMSLAVVALVSPAGAHITANPSSAAQGGFAKIAFRVPNERDDASTTKIEIDIPASAKLQFVSVRPVAGWTYATTKAGKQVTAVTWTAEGAGIKAGEFQEFEVSLGELPKADEIVFTAIQTYSSGEVVTWNEPMLEGGTEPEHPAPVLTLVKAADAGAATTGDDGDESNTLAMAALLVGALGVVLGGAALAISRRRSS
jgi:uncharacterized protein YcnI